MKDQLERAIKLAKKTGDRLLVYDSQKPDDTYVVMSIDEYEKIVDTDDLTEDDMTDKINRDIATWRSEQFAYEGDYYGDWRASRSDSSFFANDKDIKRETEPKESEKRGNPWKIPRDVKKAAENSKNIKIDDDNEK